MDVYELYDLTSWYQGYFKSLRTLYSQLHSLINHNATQPSKQPLQEPLVALVDFLEGMDLSRLTLQQLALLEDLGVDQFIGPEGARWVENSVKTEAYDPATTDAEFAAAISAIGAAQQKLSDYATAVKSLGFEREEVEPEGNRVLVRVGFRNDASIRNVKDWKSSADDWYQIVRGLALVAGEAPEETKVVGASTGSIILILSATVAVTTLLATIAKHITSTAKEVLTLQITLEELRQKKILTQTMEAEFNRLQSEARSSAQKKIEEEVRKVAKSADGEQQTALTKSVQKLLKFGEDGGDIDFVAPPEPEDAESDDEQPQTDNDDMIAAIEEVRTAILAYQEEREAIKLLPYSERN